MLRIGLPHSSITISWKRRFLSVFGLLFFFLFSCVEPFEGEEFLNSFEDILVVNSTLTNQLKRQEVILTRSFEFNEDEIPKEEGAQVIISSDSGQNYPFEEVSPGTYHSIAAFAAQMNQAYTLTITTQDGRSYSSEAMELPAASTEIDRLYAERLTNDEGIEGMSIFVDSFDPSGTSRLYRHEFVETFKVIAPFWSPFDAVVVSEGRNTFDVRAILREQEERVCFGEQRERNIIVNSTLGLSEDRLDRYQVRFIDRDDYILSYRYSVLVRQFVHSPAAFSFYETLQGLAQTTGNIFSEDQPGFLQGNIFGITDPNENVAGFFDVATVAEKRIFFDYEDFFPNEELPPYTADCLISAPTTTGTLGQRALLNLIYDDKIRFYNFNNGTIPGGGPFLVVRKICGDCTAIGSNKIPDFWIE